jgi:hypothetical protein
MSILFLAAALAGSEAYATCSYPKAPDKIPDGNTASLQDMLAAQKKVKAFDTEIKAYTDCLRLEHDQEVAKIDPKTDPDKSKAQKAELDSVLVKKNDAAVDDDTTVTSRFNEQVRVFKAKAKKGKS